MKTLITHNNLHKFCQNDMLCVQPDQLLTPGAHDLAQKMGVQIVFGQTAEAVVDTDPEHVSSPALNLAEIAASEAKKIVGDGHFSLPVDQTLPEKSIMMPPINLMGSGCLEKAAKRVGFMGYRKGLVVSDAMLNKMGVVTTVTEVLAHHGIATVVYDGVQPNPTTTNVKEGLLKLRQQNCDFVISLGGGSPHDCAKAIALLSTNGGAIEDYEGIEKSTKPALPLVAINTTAGTASEMTRFCIITNEETKVKMAIVDPNVTPSISVNDPQLMLGMPASLTAATGMDALTHAIEAYVSSNTNPMTDAVASKAIEIIMEYLPRAVEDGSDMDAREKMACAQFMAGVAFNNAGLGYVHAMAHQLGGMYGLPHGVCNAVLLPHVMAFNMRCRAKRLSDVAYFLGCKVKGMAHDEAAIEGIKRVCQLLVDVGMPTSLSALDVKDVDIPTMAANAMQDASALTNPCKGTQADIEKIFAGAM